MAAIINEFLAELPAKLRAIEEAILAEDFQQLESLTRTLKGEAGGYGFDPITEAAAKVETALIQKFPPQRVRARLDKLVNWCLRARSSAQGR